MERDTKSQYFLKMAKHVSTQATCPRRAVGCVIVDKNNHVLSTGFNGVPKNYTHCTDKPCGGQNFKSGQGLDKCMATHAEQNALLQCRNVNEIHIMYLTLSPCTTCAKLIANTGCKKVIFSEQYSTTDGIDMLKKLGIGVWYERIED